MESRAAGRLRQGQAAFNRGAFFDAHELWEEVWRDLAGAERVAVQGLIQIAAGLHHLQHGRPGPAASLLGKGVEKLSRAAPPPLLAHLRVDALARGAARLLSAAPSDTPDLTTLEPL